MSYLVFAGDTYYPRQGWNDYVGKFDTCDEAREAALKQKSDWWQIVDLSTMSLWDWNDD